MRVALAWRSNMGSGVVVTPRLLALTESVQGRGGQENLVSLLCIHPVDERHWVASVARFKATCGRIAPEEASEHGPRETDRQGRAFLLLYNGSCMRIYVLI